MHMGKQEAKLTESSAQKTLVQASPKYLVTAWLTIHVLGDFPLSTEFALVKEDTNQSPEPTACGPSTSRSVIKSRKTRLYSM
jgi:hypothetical protein